jgi:hypothetical protein
MIAEYPLTGSRPTDIKIKGYRQLLVYNFRLIYKVVGENVYITAIVHGARLLPKYLRIRFRSIDSELN